MAVDCMACERAILPKLNGCKKNLFKIAGKYMGQADRFYQRLDDSKRTLLK